jgi:[lysine-biosynthesis-protein LysW]--L-2-aminoadipate ligase
MGDGLLAIDLFETDEGLTVNEVNHTMEFRNSIDTTGVDIPARMVDYVIAQGRGMGQTLEMEPVYVTVAG